jgi:hypothetical protein
VVLLLFNTVGCVGDLAEFGDFVPEGAEAVFGEFE